MLETISIIVPVYNVEKYVSTCIASIVNQTYKYLEIILVDDGSTDSSGSICDKYAKEDERIIVIHQDNHGIVSARKKGLGCATGEYIIFVDADDWIDSGMCLEAINLMRKTKADQIDFGIADIHGAKKNIRYSKFEEGLYEGEEFVEKILPTCLYSGEFFEYGILPYACNKMFKKNLILDTYFFLDDSACIFEGAVCEFTYLSKSKSLYISHKCFYNYRYREDSLKHIFSLEDEKQLLTNHAILKAVIMNSKYAEILMNQYEIWKKWTMLWKSPQLLDDIDNGVFLTPYGGITRKQKIALYGAGGAGTNIREYLENVCQLKILAWTDIHYDELKKKLPLCSISDFLSVKFDVVIVGILRASAAKSAITYLLDLGIDKSKIRWIKDEFYLKNER